MFETTLPGELASLCSQPAYTGFRHLDDEAGDQTGSLIEKCTRLKLFHAHFRWTDDPMGGLGNM